MLCETQRGDETVLFCEQKLTTLGIAYAFNFCLSLWERRVCATMAESYGAGTHPHPNPPLIPLVPHLLNSCPRGCEPRRLVWGSGTRSPKQTPRHITRPRHTHVHALHTHLLLVRASIEPGHYKHHSLMRSTPRLVHAPHSSLPMPLP